MDQVTARRLAKALTEEVQGRLIYIATTQDALAGRWEKTNEWVVVCLSPHEPPITEIPEGVTI